MIKTGNNLILLVVEKLDSQPSETKIKKFRFLKSINTVKQDSNKKIINEVLYRKISTHKTKIDTSGVNSKFNSSTLGNFKHLQKMFNTYKQVIYQFEF